MVSIVVLFIFFSSLFLQIDQSKEIKSCEEVKDCGACANGTIDINGVKCEWCSTTRRCSGYVLNTCPLEDRIPHPYNCPSSVNWDIYNENFTREIVLPLIGAVNAKPRKQLNRLLSACFRKARLINHYEVSCDVRTNLSNCYAYMVYFPSHGALALTFRGTSNVFQLIDEIISMSLYEKIFYEPTGGAVDHYYHDAFYKLWNSGMKRDFERELQAEDWLH